MSTPALAPPVPGSIDDVRNKVCTGNFFALCYLMLCQLSYVKEQDGQLAKQEIKRLLPTMPVPKDIPAQWQLGWIGVDQDNSNLMFAAEFVMGNPAAKAFTAVVIRGTDVESEPAGLLQQLIEDLDAEIQVPFPVNDPNSKIAQGTQIGFSTLSQLTDNGKTIQDYVRAFVQGSQGAPVVVTGHSLGGCQTTVMALDLATRLPDTVIVPATFAAPTAGNAAFVQLYQQKCGACSRWFNQIDLVPMAYADLEGILKLWDVCQTPAPLLVKFAIAGLELLLEKVVYLQPDHNQFELANGCRPPQVSALPPTFENETVRKVEAVLIEATTRIQAAGRLQKVVERFEDEIKLPIPGLALGPLSLDLLANQVAARLPVIANLTFTNLFNWVEDLMFQHLIMTGYWNAVKASPNVAPVPNPFDQAQAAAGGGNGN